ncbi:MAG: alginate export family protein, partial [Planctomycetes bacterium]|nr:alginate export family protein [Planctomycetota bacterium]
MFLTTQRRWPLVCAIVGLYLIPSAVSAQSDLETLNQKIQAMEAREAASDRRIQELEARLADFEAGDHATSGRLETLINGVFETEGAQVSTPKSQMLKIGGQFRFRGEYRTTRDYSAGGVGNGADFVIQRTRLNFDFRVMENLRAFVELQDSRLWGEEPSVVGDLEGVDIHQAYVDFENAFHAPLTFRVGRQELSYGDQRLVSPLDWHPVGRTFDGVRAFYEEGDWQLDAFVANVREAHPAGERDDDLIFAGLYWHFMGLENHEIDAYLFYRSYANGAFVAENGVAG